MACSQSDNEGQLSVVCQTCEEETKLKWKCLDCEVIMCQKCKEKIHPKFKFSSNHRIIHIKEVEVKNEEHNNKMIFCNIKCIQHPEQIMILYCESCGKFACTSCIIETHKNHSLVEISDGYNIKIEKMKKGKQEIQKKKNNFIEQIRKLKDMKISTEPQKFEVNKNILSYVTSLINTVQEHAKILRGELEQKYESIQKSIEQEIDRIHRLEKDAEEHIIKLELLIATKDAAVFFNNLSLEESACFAASILWQDMTLPKFVPREIHLSGIGVLQAETITKIENNIEESASINVTNVKTKTENKRPLRSSFRVVKIYDTGLSCINKIVACSDGSLWISTGCKGVLQKVTSSDGKLEIINNQNAEVYSMALTFKNDLIFANSQWKEPRLQIIHNYVGTRQCSIQNMACELESFGFRSGLVHVSFDNHIYVGADNIKTGKQAIFIMNQNGKHIAKFEQDVLNKPIFSNIIDLTHSTNFNIFMIDGLTGIYVGYRVVVLRNGVQTVTYEGHPDMNSNARPFAPLRITTAPSTNIVVYDVSTNSLHILNNNAQLLTHLDLHITGIPSETILPMCFSNENVFIVVYRCPNRSENDKLYILDISGCPELVKTTR